MAALFQRVVCAVYWQFELNVARSKALPASIASGGGAGEKNLLVDMANRETATD